MATIDTQLLMLSTAEACEALQVRPGRLPDEPEPAIIGERYDRDRLLEKLKPALEQARPDAPTEPADLAPFLDEAAPWSRRRNIHNLARNINAGVAGGTDAGRLQDTESEERVDCILGSLTRQAQASGDPGAVDIRMTD